MSVIVSSHDSRKSSATNAVLTALNLRLTASRRQGYEQGRTGRASAKLSRNSGESEIKVGIGSDDRQNNNEEMMSRGIPFKQTPGTSQAMGARRHRFTGLQLLLNTVRK